MKKIVSCLLLGLIATLHAEDDKALVKNHDMLEVSKNFLKTYEVHEMFSDSKRTLGRLNNVNFSMKPLVAPIKPFDTLKTHYAYPLKIFLPKGATVTSAMLSNSKAAPVASQNVVIVKTDEDFESGLLDIVYIQGFDLNTASYISIKLDVYSSLLADTAIAEQLFTQVEYYNPKKLQNSEIIAALSPEKYNEKHSQLKYMGILYDVYLVNVVKDSKIIEQFKDSKYINAGVLHNGYSYNYYIK